MVRSVNAKLSHPTPEQLAAFVQGRLSPAEQTTLEEHIAGCEACCRKMQAAPDDTLLGQLRGSATPLHLSRPAGVSQQAAQEVPPELIDHPRYRIVRQLGIGGMGVVYQAEHRLMERTVALKVINRRFVRHPLAAEPFRVEVRAAAKLSHPNIVTAHDAEQAGELHFLVMEFVDGLSLVQYVERQGPLSVMHACNFVRQAAIGLQHAFECGMIHRDIKPQNLMLTRQGKVKILDFGLARFAREVSAPEPGGISTNDDSASLTTVGSVIGTPDYIAPEQVRDSRQADIRADIYSLGCTLYFLLTGRVPYPQGSVTQKLESHVDYQVPLLVKENVPPELSAIVARMMAKDPGERYQTPIDVAKALAVLAKPAKETSGGSPFIVADSPSGITTRVKAKPAARKRWSGPLWVGAAALLACVFGFWQLQQPDAASDIAPVATSPVKTSEPPVVSPRNLASATATNLPKASVATSKINSGKPVLIVVPNAGVWAEDYLPVRKLLEDNGVQVRVAAQWRGPCELSQAGAPPVMPDVSLSQVSPDDFSALVFVGGRCNEFKPGGSAAAESRRLIDNWVQVNKPLGAICLGQLALHSANVLKNKKVADSSWTRQQINDSQVQWVDQPVVETGHIITARGPLDAEPFARAILKAISRSP